MNQTGSDNVHDEILLKASPSPIITQVTRDGKEALKAVFKTPEDGLSIGEGIDWQRVGHGYLVLDVLYDSGHSGVLIVQFYAKGEQEARIYAVLGVFPRLLTRLSLPLEVLDGQKLFLERTPGRLKGVCNGRRLSPGDIDRIRLTLRDTGDEQTLYIYRMALVSMEPDYPIPDRFIVDEFGQWKGKDWIKKVKSALELKERLMQELEYVDKAVFPTDWSRYGGSKNVVFKRTGYFRTEYDGKCWWLVDPDGYGFFSAGMDCVHPGSETRLMPGMEKLCEGLPPCKAEFAPAYLSRQNSEFCDFPIANLIRVFGRDWFTRWSRLTRGRLIEWRFNTIGNWSDLKFTRTAHLPYVLPMQNFPSTQTLLFRDFPDVYAPEYRDNAAIFASQLVPYVRDPWLIGYFLTNEPEWGFGAYNLAAEMLEDNPGTYTRKELTKWMSVRYQGDTMAWSKAWDMQLDSFEQLETSLFHRVGEQSKKAYEDLWEFSRMMIHTYARIASEETHKVAPNHLNLGLRYAWIASDLMYAASEYFDVFTINNYHMYPPEETIQEITARTNRPVLIGEFHFGALDRGLPSSGLRRVDSQLARGVAYRRYVEACAANPNLVGVHYFQLNDQSLLGRYDGENYQIGFVDCCQTPYREIAYAAKAAHEHLYTVRLRKSAPYSAVPKEWPWIAF